MGTAILGVLVAHSIGFGEIDGCGIGMKILHAFPRLVFTEGFLFLSGFGLYYSFCNNTDVRMFYLKRVKRLLIPFIMLSAWYFIAEDLWIAHNPLKFLGHISSLAFWTEGNYNGMWYIAISVMLYALFPLLYHYIFRSEHRFARLLIIVVAMLLIPIAVRTIDSYYYDKVGIGIRKLPMFVIGMALGHLSLRKSLSAKLIGVGYSVIVILYMLTIYMDKHYADGIHYRALVERLILIPIVTTFFVVLSTSRITSSLLAVLRWFGKYTLELYVLHLLIWSFLGIGPLFPKGVFVPLRLTLTIVIPILTAAPIHTFNNRISQKLLKTCLHHL